MYSGPFVLWNFDSPEMDADEGCMGQSPEHRSNKKKN